MAAEERTGAQVADLTRRNDLLSAEVEQRTALLHLLRAIAFAAHEAGTIEAAVRFALRAICDHTGWEAGHAWRVDRAGGAIVPTGLWHGHVPPPLVAATRAARGVVGEGILGAVAASGEPWWHADVRDEPRWHSREAATAAGLPSVCLFPVLAVGECVAILEFFSARPVAPAEEEGFLQAMRSAGMQLGLVVERKELERVLADRSAEQMRNLGRELHDSLGQQVAGLAMLAASLQAKLQARGAPEAAYAAELLAATEEAKRQVRRLAHGLSPVDVDAHGLMNALAHLADGSSVLYGVTCEFRCERAAPVEDNLTATHLYRIAQEALHNAAQHGTTSRILLSLKRADDALVLEIRDDGGGIGGAAAPGPGMGLRIMRHRAALIGGRLDVRTVDGGTSVRCTLPVVP